MRRGGETSPDARVGVGAFLFRYLRSDSSDRSRKSACVGGRRTTDRGTGGQGIRHSCRQSPSFSIPRFGAASSGRSKSYRGKSLYSPTQYATLCSQICKTWNRRRSSIVCNFRYIRFSATPSRVFLTHLLGLSDEQIDSKYSDTRLQSVLFQRASPVQWVLYCNVRHWHLVFSRLESLSSTRLWTRYRPTI